MQHKKADGRKDKAKQNAANDVSNYFSRAVGHLDEHDLMNDLPANGGLATHRRSTSGTRLAVIKPRPKTSIHGSVSKSAIHHPGGSTTYYTWSTSPERHHQPPEDGRLYVRRTPDTQRRVKGDVLSEQAMLASMLHTGRHSKSDTTTRPEETGRVYNFEDLKALAKAGSTEAKINIPPAITYPVLSAGEPQLLASGVDRVAGTIVEDEVCQEVLPRDINDHQHRKGVPSHLHLREQSPGFHIRPPAKECGSSLTSQKHKREKTIGGTAVIDMLPNREEARFLGQNELAMLARKSPIISAGQPVVLTTWGQMGKNQDASAMDDDSHQYQFVGARERERCFRNHKEPLPSLYEAPQANEHRQDALHGPHEAVLHEHIGLGPNVLDAKHGIPTLDNFSSQPGHPSTEERLYKEDFDLDDEELDDFDRQLLASDQIFSLVHATAKRYVSTPTQHGTQRADGVRQNYAVIQKPPAIRLHEYHDMDALTHFWQPQIRY